MAIMPASGQVAEPTYLLNPSPIAGRERLGAGLAQTPGMVLCGAPGYGAQGIDAGGVLAFRLDRAANRWLPEPWLTVPGAAAGDGFGAAVSASGSALAVGSSGDNRVAVFDLDDPNGAPVVLSGGPDFGRAVAIDGGTLAIGEPQRSGVVGRGRVSVFTRDAEGSWLGPQILQVDSLAINAGFGSAIAIRGQRLVVGAPSAAGAGAAYVYERNGATGSWSLRATIRPALLIPGDQFGAAVAIGDRELLIGAPATDAVVINGGAAYVVPIAVGTGAFGPAVRVLSPSPASNALFGSAVAASGDLIAIGAPLGDGFAGEVWTYRRQSDETFVASARFAANNGEDFASFGSSVVIGDEFIAVAAPQLDASPFQPDAGRVAIYQSLTTLGYTGDCNNNGTDDLVDLFIARTATDCNGNGRIDACEIADNPDLDSDNDGVLDGCVSDCPADQNLDGLLTPADFNAWLLNYNLGCP